LSLQGLAARQAAERMGLTEEAIRLKARRGKRAIFAHSALNWRPFTISAVVERAGLGQRFQKRRVSGGAQNLMAYPYAAATRGHP
jgi:hypothetical protein